MSKGSGEKESERREEGEDKGRSLKKGDAGMKEGDKGAKEVRKVKEERREVGGEHGNM